MSELLDAFWHAPPFARNYATAIVVLSLNAYFGPSWILGSVFMVAERFRLDRLLDIALSFFISGDKLDFIMDPYNAYQNLKQLETANTKFSTKEDLLWYLLTVASFMMGIMRLATGHWGGMFLRGMVIAMCYTANQDLRGQKAHFLFFTVPAQSAPYCMLIWTLIARPEDIPVQVSGILAAHLHDFLTRLWPEFGLGPNLLPTPGIISKLVQTPTFFKRGYGAAIRPKDSTSGSSTGSSDGPVLPDSWKGRGSGHRLG